MPLPPVIRDLRKVLYVDMSENIPVIDIVLKAGRWPDDGDIDNLASKAVFCTITIAKLQLPPQAELSIVLSDNRHVQALNRQWRNIDRPTNVLTFPAQKTMPGKTPGLMLGDIVLARETIVQEAAEQEKSLDAHLSHLIVHGFLHIFGYDHQDDAEAEIMENLEKNCLMALGISDPYIKPCNATPTEQFETN